MVIGDSGNDDLDFYQAGGQYVDHSHDSDRKRFKGTVVALCNAPLQAGVTKEFCTLPLDLNQ